MLVFELNSFLIFNFVSFEIYVDPSAALSLRPIPYHYLPFHTLSF